MPLELRRQRDGTLRRQWYGRYEVNGRRVSCNLGVRVRGAPPASLRETGDALFERSRAEAQARLDSVVEESSSPRDTGRLLERIYQIKTGETLDAPAIDQLAAEWRRIPRRRQPHPDHLAACSAILNRFARFMHEHYPAATDIAHVTRSIARHFMDEEGKRGVAPRTWNESLSVLRAALKYLLPAGCVNPFAGLPTRTLDTVYRKPFTAEELKAIAEAAANDDFIRPIIITGMCTAMRRGDCCLLRWADVDLDKRFITVKTSKTGQTISIPIFPLLYTELARRSREGEYVFPEQARMYRENESGITARVRKVLARAGFVDPAEAAKHNDAQQERRKALAALPPEELVARADAALATRGTAPARRARLLATLRLYLAGKPVPAIAEELAVSRSTAWLHLRTLERLTGAAVLRQRGPETPAVVRGETRTERRDGLRRASVRDFHSFRVTWVTLALSAGVPMELVTRVTGHKTTDVVLKHYFQPGREEFRRALEAAMPALLSNGQTPATATAATATGPSPKEEALALIDSLKGKLTARDKARLRELVGRLE